jgi:hypothetical protein
LRQRPQHPDVRPAARRAAAQCQADARSRHAGILNGAARVRNSGARASRVAPGFFQIEL